MNDTLVGVIVGAILTGGFTWFIEWRKSVGEKNNRLKEKREDIYLKAISCCLNIMTDVDFVYNRQISNALIAQANNMAPYMKIYASASIWQLYAEIHKKLQNKDFSEDVVRKLDKLVDEMREDLGVKD